MMKPRDFKPRDLAERMKRRRDQQRLDDGFKRETFKLPVLEARAKAAEILKRYPKAAYDTQVENWRALPNGDIEFTMKRLPSAD